MIEQNPPWKLALDLGLIDTSNTRWLERIYQEVSSTTTSEEKEQHPNNIGLAYVLSPFFDNYYPEDSFSDQSTPPTMAVNVYKYRKVKSTGNLKLNVNAQDPETIISSRPKALYKTIDFEILEFLQAIQKEKFSWSNSNPPIAIPQILLDKTLSLLSKSDFVFWRNAAGENKKVSIQNKIASFSVQGILNDNGLDWQKILKVDNRILEKEEIVGIFDYYPILVLTSNYRLFKLDNMNDIYELEALINASPLSKHEFNNNEVIQKLTLISQHTSLSLPTQWTKKAIKLTPTPVVYFKLKPDQWDITLKFRYQDTEFEFQPKASPLFISKDNKSKNVFALRDLTLENSYLNRLSDILPPAKQTQGHFSIENEDNKKSLIQILTDIPKNWEVWLDDDDKPVSRSKGNFNFENTSNIDWLEISGDLSFDDKKLELAKVVGAVIDGKPLLKIDGQSFMLSPAQLRKIKRLQQLYDPNQKKIRLHRTHLGLLEDLSDIVDSKDLHKQWQQSLLALKNFKGVKKIKQSKNLKASLRNYQQTGLNWLHFLKDSRFGGILADDMGLGKTIQALAILSFSHEKLKKPRMSLIVAPTTVVYNWEQEIKKFTPKLKVNIYMGKDRTLPKKGEADIVVTSYALVWRDIEKLKKIDWHYNILDESQYIKNSKSKTFKAICSVNADHRLSLTGTPLENNLAELWSQFNFVNPGLFNTLQDFKQEYQNPIEKNNDKEAKKKLKKIIKPFLLRRSKKEVLKDLPNKVEEIKWCEMNEAQASLYNAVKTYYQAKVFNLIENKGIAKGQIVILNALLRLRQVCCHPQLLKLDSKKNSIKLPKKLQKITSSIKTEIVVEMLKSLMAEGHKVLLFSQFTSMLDILIKQLKDAGIPTMVLTGKTSHKQRKALIKEFQENNTPCVFLLSLKAGGTGLNLTAANYVIHYDPWWNPAVELQATDRAHRIGQKNSVNVYKFLVKDTIEEKILELQKKKKGLVDELIDSGVSKRITKKDLEFLFK